MRDDKNFYETSGETEEIIFDEADFEKLLGEGEEVIYEDVDGDEVFVIEDDRSNDIVYEDDFEDDFDEDDYFEEEQESVRTVDPLRSAYAKRPLGEPYKADRKAPVTEYFEAPDETVVYSKKQIEESLDDDYEEDEDDDDVSVANIFSGAFADKLIYLTGALIIVCAIIVGIVLITGKTRRSLAGPDMGDIGLSLADVNMIGEEGIRGVFGSQADKLTALYEAAESFDYVEVDEETGLVNVSLALTTIQKDLKIKFVNRNNKLIANVPFKAEVTDSKGNTTTYTDDDKDGIIYLTDIAGGEYRVKMIALDTFSSLYAFSDEKQSVTVKDKIEYAKVDVSNEVKKESQVNIAKEDKKTEEVAVEGKLNDTVEYVMSQKTSLTDESGFAEIPKEKLKDPKTIISESKKQASGYRRFRRLDSGHSPSISGGNDIGVLKSTDLSVSSGDGTAITDVSWGCSGALITAGAEKTSATVTSGMVTTDTTITVTAHVTFADDTTDDLTYTMTIKAPSVGEIEAGDVKGGTTGNTASIACSYCDGLTVTVTWDVSSTAVANFKGSGNSVSFDTNLVYANTPATITASVSASDGTQTYKLADKTKTISVLYDATSDKCSFKATNDILANMAIGQTQSVTYAATGMDGSTLAASDYTITPSSSNPAVATIDAAGTITAIATGTAHLELTCKSAKMSKDITISFDVTIDVSKVLVTLDKTELIIFRGSSESYGLTATVTGDLKKMGVTWKSGDESKVKVSETGALTPVADGSVEIVCISKEDPTKTAKCAVTVVLDPSQDEVTKLTDVDGNPVYKYDAASKKYVEAKFADYYNGTKLFIATKVEYKYMGWWTVGGKTYYYDKNGKKVTGEQVILGTKYSFNSDGVLISGDGTFGIDVSKWNGTIDWNSVAKSGVSFAIIRCGIRGCTEGGLIEDSKYTTNIKNATAAGIKVGVYFFTQATNEVEAVEEASMVLYQIKDYKISYPVFLDVEYSNPDHDGRADGLDAATRTKVIRAFCQTIANSGYTAGFYANKTWLETKINTAELTQYKIWLAQYNDRVTYGNTRHDLWQYTSKGSISGISGNVDLDHSYLGY